MPTSRPAMPRIFLSIDKLVLRGVDRADAAAVTGALQEELQRLLASGDATLATQASTRALQAGHVRLRQGDDAAALGRVVATRIARPPAADRTPSP